MYSHKRHSTAMNKTTFDDENNGNMADLFTYDSTVPQTASPNEANMPDPQYSVFKTVLTFVLLLGKVFQVSGM
jgi:hypothetical protein